MRPALVLTLMLTPSLARAAQDPAEPETGARTAKEELAKAAETTQGLQSYAFHVEIDIVSPMGVPPEKPTIEGRYEKDAGMYASLHFVQQIEIVRIAKSTAVRQDPDPDWQVFRAADLGPIEQMLEQIQAPHEELKGFAKLFHEVEKTRDTDRFGREDATLFQGAFSKEGAKSSLPLQRIADFLPNAEFEGSGKAWISESGRILKYEVETTIRGDFNGQELDVVVTRVVELSGLNETRAEIPDDAREAIDAASKKKEEGGKKKDPAAKDRGQ